MQNNSHTQWICVRLKGLKVDQAEYRTLKWTRKESIAAMLANKSKRPAYSWKELRGWGWRCVKASISFHVTGTKVVFEPVTVSKNGTV